MPTQANADVSLSSNPGKWAFVVAFNCFSQRVFDHSAFGVLFCHALAHLDLLCSEELDEFEGGAELPEGPKFMRRVRNVWVAQYFCFRCDYTLTLF